MHEKQQVINDRWHEEGLPPFGLGLGLSTGEAAAALLGSEERLEYTLVGDTVNMSQRLQQLAEAGETVVSQGTVDAWRCAPPDDRPATSAGQGTRDAGRCIQTGRGRTPRRWREKEGI